MRTRLLFWAATVVWVTGFISIFTHTQLPQPWQTVRLIGLYIPLLPLIALILFPVIPSLMIIGWGFVFPWFLLRRFMFPSPRRERLDVAGTVYGLLISVAVYVGWGWLLLSYLRS